MRPIIFRMVLSLTAVFLFGSLAAGQAQYNVLYSFGANQDDGNLPNGGLVFDKTGNLYGTTQFGGTSSVCNQGCGTAFELSPSPDGTWTETVIYSFCSQANCADGLNPLAGLVVDAAGNLYGTTERGGSGSSYGTVFELSPPKAPGQAWVHTVLWNFLSNGGIDGAFPAARLTWDAAGNLYGTTFEGSGGLGTVFELSPVQGRRLERAGALFLSECPSLR